MKTLVSCAALSLAATGAASASCYSLDAGGEAALMAGYSVTEAAAGPELMDRPPVADDAIAVLCERPAPEFREKDFELLHHGLALYVRSGPDDAATVISLSLREGNEYAVQLHEGDLSEDDVAAITAVLEGFDAGEAALARHYQAQEDG
ncbi:MAG: hypothetical protein LAT81_01280 [Oceanicaulis sp.]|nr:hypothetical protein [Oceanicaulis sp.]